MLESDVLEKWFSEFENALSEPDATRIDALFHDDSHWRDVLAFS